MTAYVVLDRQREVQFDGELLASSTSDDGHKLRWGEFFIYRTRAGNYVVSGIGKSRRPGETDRCWAQVSEDPEGVIEKLTLIDDDGTRYLPYTARQLLDQACTKDEGLRRAYAVEVVE